MSSGLVLLSFLLCNTLPLTVLCFVPSPLSSTQRLTCSRAKAPTLYDAGSTNDAEESSRALPDAMSSSAPMQWLKDEIIEISRRTDRGFSASSSYQKRARELIFELARYNPTLEPAIPFYQDSRTGDGPSLAGKWTLIYTDAPDITSLYVPQQQQQQRGLALPPTAKLGRIGQECVPPFIQNVIEWQRPDWASNLPFLSGPKRVLQKVVTEAVASPTKPTLVQLKFVGFDLLVDSDDDDTPRYGDLVGSISTLLKKPIQARFPLALPFGEFEILFLDEEMRAIRTGQNYLAVNIREPTAWF